MRVFTKLIIDIATGELLASREYEYLGKRAHAKGGGGGTSTTTNSLPAFLQPYATQFIQAYQNQAFDDSGNPIAMPGNLTMQTAGFAPEQEAAFGQIGAMTPGAQGLANTGAMNAGQTLRGDYLDPSTNPWLQKTFDQAAQGVTDTYSTATAPGIMAAAQKAGQFGSTAMNEALAQSRYGLGQNLNNLATNIYGGNYQQERSNQLATQQNLPNTINSLYAPAQALAGVGAQRQAQTQSEYDTGYANASNQAEWPFNILSGFGSALGQAAGGGGTSTTRSTNSPAGMFGSVVCTALHDFGLMDDETFAADSLFGQTLPAEAIRGYHRFGIPLANLMRRSFLITALIKPIALSWGQTMKARVNGHPEDETLLGRVLLRLGVPYCVWLGRKEVI